MNLPQLQFFLATTEDRHFIRAADRLHIEQSPLFRTIRDLGHDLGVTLFERGAGIGAYLTLAGQALAESAPRIFSLVDPGTHATLAAAADSLATLCVALSDGILPKRLAALLACGREEEHDINLQLFEAPLAEQPKAGRGGDWCPRRLTTAAHRAASAPGASLPRDSCRTTSAFVCWPMRYRYRQGCCP